METREVIEVEREGSIWRVAMQTPSGKFLYVFPVSTIDLRAAEYGMDPTDSKTMLDIILHEHYITGHEHTHPKFVYNTDEKTAREHYLGLIEDVKKNAVQVTDPNNLLEQIHQEHPRIRGELRRYGMQIHDWHKQRCAELRAERMKETVS